MKGDENTAGGATVVSPPLETRPPKVRMRPGISIFNATVLRRATSEAFVKLDPRHMKHNPMMFVVEIGSLITTIEFFAHPSVFSGLITAWLWATVLFANFAETVAEGRGKTQTGALRRTRQDTVARVIGADGAATTVPPGSLKVGDHCVVVAGGIIPGDGDVVEGIATVDESASAPSAESHRFCVSGPAHDQTPQGPLAIAT
jgi:K+-transporting ATPase ATPase B chain